jgi:hypothetical protein
MRRQDRMHFSRFNAKKEKDVANNDNKPQSVSWYGRLADSEA